MSLPDFVTGRELAQTLRISRQRLSLWVASGRVPRPCKPSSQMCLWHREEITAWIAAGMPPRQEWEQRAQEVAR